MTGLDLQKHRPRTRAARIFAYAGAVATMFAAVAVPCPAASIPVWLDDAITSWNERNPTLQFEFVDIKDSFVWYRIQDGPEFGQKEIRSAADRLTVENGYAPRDEEEQVTTGKPPTTNSPNTPKKCWRRSFLLDLESASHTTSVGGDPAGLKQRMLTRMVCEDGPNWATGFRIAE